MDTKKLKKILPWGGVALPVILAVAVLIFGLLNRHTVTKVLLIISAVLLVLLAAALYFLLIGFGNRRNNYFLTDDRSGRSIPEDKLTFGIINEKMNSYLAGFIEDESELWTGDFLLRRGIFGQRDVFRPLTVYKMLFDLAEQNNERSWRMFRAMPDKVFDQMTRSLNAVQDVNMARALMQLRQSYDDKKLADFVIGNRKYIQGRIMRFVRANIALFDIEE